MLPTGAGKSLCYQLPARLASGLTVVVVPLLSLLQEQLERCRQAGLKADALRGGQQEEQRLLIGQGIASGGLELLFTTPESLGGGRAQRSLSAVQIGHLVVDEAHCVSEWGKSFRPAYLRLGQIIRGLQVRSLSAFTATAGPEVLQTVKQVLFCDREPRLVTADPDRPNIRYRVIPVLAKARALQQLAGSVPRPLLIFSRTRSGAEWAARTLRRRFPELSSYFYHAGLNAEERARIEGWYRQSRDGILAATSAYGMGMDKQDIRTVAHLDLPYSPEAYLQETGRAGRDGRPVEAVLFCSPEDLVYAERLDNPLASRRYGQMRIYALDGGRCRRTQLLALMGQEAGPCNGCDVCDGRVRSEPEGERQILDFLRPNSRRFTLRQAVHVLLGRPGYEVVRGRLASVYGFGFLGDWLAEDIEAALVALRLQGVLRIPEHGLWKERIALVAGGRPGNELSPAGFRE